MNAMQRVIRHDHTDLRRLAELGIQPLAWRHGNSQTQAPNQSWLVISDDNAAKGIVADLLRSLSMAGHNARRHDATTGDAAAKNVRVIAFGAAMTERIPANIVLTLPPVAELRGNPAAKRAAWSMLRKALR